MFQGRHHDMYVSIFWVLRLLWNCLPEDLVDRTTDLLEAVPKSNDDEYTIARERLDAVNELVDSNNYYWYYS